MVDSLRMLHGGSQVAESHSDELLERLGAAVVSEWNDLSMPARRSLFEGAVRVGQVVRRWAGEGSNWRVFFTIAEWAWEHFPFQLCALPHRPARRTGALSLEVHINSRKRMSQEPFLHIESGTVRLLGVRERGADRGHDPQGNLALFLPSPQTGRRTSRNLRSPPGRDSRGGQAPSGERFAPTSAAA